MKRVLNLLEPVLGRAVGWKDTGDQMLLEFEQGKLHIEAVITSRSVTLLLCTQRHCERHVFRLDELEDMLDLFE